MMNTSPTKEALHSNPNNNSGDANDSNSNMTDTFSRFAKTAFSSDNLESAGRAAKEKALELQKQAREGDRSLRFLAFVGGVACTLVGLLELTTRLARLAFLEAIIDVYIVLLGCVVIALEGRDVFLSKGIVQSINKHALFLTFLWGRGALYFVCGTLQLTQIDIFTLIVGGYMCFVGILYIVVGNTTAKKLRAIGVRKSLFSEEILRSKFRAADVGGDGLTLVEFRDLCQDLDLDLAGREVEATFGTILQSTSNGTGHGHGSIDGDKLSYSSFKSWWDALEDGGADDAPLADNACAFV